MCADSNPNGHSGVVQNVEKIRNSVFSNDLFWRLLGMSLNFGDLKVCRLVSQNFNRKVLEETNFKRRVIIKLSMGRLQPTVFGSTVEKWKNVQIQAFAWSQVCRPATDLTWLRPLLSDVEELYVWMDRCFHMPMEALYHSAIFDEPVNLYPPLHIFLESTNCLKKLSIDHEFLRHADVNIHLSSLKTVDETLANLTELELTASRGRQSCETFGKWMDKLASALEKVSVLKADRVLPEDSDFPGVKEHLHTQVRELLRIIEGNYYHITTLKLDDMQLWSNSSVESLQSISRMVFPLLNSVQIRMSQIESENLIHFLRQHSLLRDIDVTVFNKCPTELLNVIMGRKELNRLCITTKRFEESSPILWERISELNNLEVFQIHLVGPNRFVTKSDMFASCIVNLPPSVKKIHLKGMMYFPVIWDRSDTIVTPGTFSNLNPDVLTELCINKCGYIVHDDILEFICRTFRFLRILNISNTSPKCTDYGFTGRPLKFNSTPFSISNLRGLKHLTLRSCGVITDETLIHGIKFTELCYLDISNNRHITPKGWRVVLAQNPCLEVLKTSKLEPFESENELKKLYPRFKEQEHIFSRGSVSDEDEDSEN